MAEISFCNLTGHLQTKELKYTLKKCSHCKERCWLRRRKMVKCIACKCVMHKKCMAKVNRDPVCTITIKEVSEEWTVKYSERPSDIWAWAQATAAAAAATTVVSSRDDVADGAMVAVRSDDSTAATDSPQVSEPREPADDMEVLRREVAGLRDAQDDLDAKVAVAETVGKLLWMVESDMVLETPQDGRDNAEVSGEQCPTYTEPADSDLDRPPRDGRDNAEVSGEQCPTYTEPADSGLDRPPRDVPAAGRHVATSLDKASADPQLSDTGSRPKTLVTAFGLKNASSEYT